MEKSALKQPLEGGGLMDLQRVLGGTRSNSSSKNCPMRRRKRPM